ncbi:MAG: peptidase M3 [Myxococcaceae bacterium]|nr:peptidase M3 [Myxococcaceae bacterium]MCI0671504.1 peptidase M3 [Myxococcaceae bacterium]
MDASVRSLRAKLDEHLTAVGEAAWRARAGLPPRPGAEDVRAGLPELRRPETYLAVQAARGGASEKASRRLLALTELVANEVEAGLAAEAEAEVERLTRLGVVSADEVTLPFHEAMAQLPREPLRQRRDALERGLSSFLMTHRSAWALRVDAAALTAERLGFPSYVALRDAVAGFSHEALASQGAGVVAATQDAYRDLLGFALKRLDARLKAQPQGQAQRHDLLAAARAPWMDAVFPREELVPALQRWLSELGLGWTAGGHLRVDTEERPGRSAGSFVARVRVPEEVHLVVSRRGGLDVWSALLRDLGHAQHAAHADPDAPVEDRWLGDASVPETYATLFELLLTDEGWLRRYLRLGHAPAREAARLAAFTQLTQLRRTVVQLAHSLDVHARGPELPLADAWAERMREVLFVEAPRGFYLHEVQRALRPARLLRGWALEVPLRMLLQERFDQDWWRNPAAGAWLRSVFSRGGRDDADVLAREWTGRELLLDPAGERLVRVLAA